MASSLSASPHTEFERLQYLFSERHARMQFVLRRVSSADGGALHAELVNVLQVANERSLVHVLADLSPSTSELLLRAALRLGLLSHRFQFLLLCWVGVCAPAIRYRERMTALRYLCFGLRVQDAWRVNLEDFQYHSNITLLRLHTETSALEPQVANSECGGMSTICRGFFCLRRSHCVLWFVQIRAARVGRVARVRECRDDRAGSRRAADPRGPAGTAQQPTAAHLRSAAAQVASWRAPPESPKTGALPLSSSTTILV